MDHAEKIEQLRRMAEAEPDDPLTWYLLGSECLREGRYADAADALGRSLDLKPIQPPAARLLGDALRRLGRAGEAADAYRRAIELAETTGDLQVAKEARVLLARLEKS